MKIAIIKSAPAGFDFGLDSVLDVICGIMGELGVDVHVADLFDDQLPHYKGVISDAAAQIADSIKTSDGVIFSTVSHIFSPSSALLTLFEYLYHDYDDALVGKNCMSVIVEQNGNTRTALDHVGKVLAHFKAHDSIRMSIDDKTAKLAVIADSDERSILERQAEDFYRIIAQSRKFFTSMLNEAISVSQETAELLPVSFDLFDNLDDKELEILEQAASKKPADENPLYKLEELSEEQAEDIEVLTSFFSKILENTEDEPEESDIILPPVKKAAPAKVVKQSPSALLETKSLANNFNSQEAAGINAVMQLNISGLGGFDGYIHIHNSECTFTQGTFDNADITVLSDAAVWLNILSGGITAQRAFMVGQLKVRGNFTILNKFDKIFGLG